MQDLPTLLIVVIPIAGFALLVAILAVVGVAGNDPVGTRELPPEGLRGRMLASWSPGGRLGVLNFSYGLLSVDLYELGMVVRPILGRGQWIAREAITALEHGRSGTLTRGTIVRSARGELMLFNGAPQHERLVAWWRPADPPGP